jgi:ABC-type polar amino acid transport system ATPase subunit
MIAVRDLVKRFGATTVLDGVSLDVRRGEVAALVGPSGGGKSTLLRCINGLETFDQGSVAVDDLELPATLAPAARSARLARVRRRVGMVFQQFNLFPHLTVLENVIEAPLNVLGQSREAAIENARELLKRVDLLEKRDAWPATLSGGQQQRVAIARALAMRPEVILFDEPTSALDPRMAAEVEAVIASLAADGQTMIVVTHSVEFTRRTASTAHVLEGGRLTATLSPQDWNG